MKECDNSKIHISSNFLFSICLLIILDTLLLGSSLHFYTLQHFTTLHPTTLHYTYWHFTSSHLCFTTLSFGLTYLHFSHQVIKCEVLLMCCGSLCTRQEQIHFILLGPKRNQAFQMNDVGTVNLILFCKSLFPVVPEYNIGTLMYFCN